MKVEDLRPKRENLRAIMSPQKNRFDFGHDKTSFRPERTEFGPERAIFGSKKAN